MACGGTELDRLMGGVGARAGGTDGSTSRRDLTEAVLRREATEQDDLLRAQRAVLSRREPMNCLEVLASHDKALLAEMRRLAHVQAEYEAALIIGTRMRYRRWPTPTEMVTQGAAMGRSRLRLRRELIWATGQRNLLANEAEAILARAAGNLQARIFKLKQKLSRAHTKAEKEELLVGGRSVPRLHDNPVFSDVRDNQLELITLERRLKNMDDLVVNTFEPRKGDEALIGGGLNTSCGIFAKRGKLGLGELSNITRAAQPRSRKVAEQANGVLESKTKESWEARERRRLAAQNAVEIQNAQRASEQLAAQRERGKVRDLLEAIHSTQQQLSGLARGLTTPSPGKRSGSFKDRGRGSVSAANGSSSAKTRPTSGVSWSAPEEQAGREAPPAAADSVAGLNAVVTEEPGERSTPPIDTNAAETVSTARTLAVAAARDAEAMAEHAAALSMEQRSAEQRADERREQDRAQIYALNELMRPAEFEVDEASRAVAERAAAAERAEVARFASAAVVEASEAEAAEEESFSVGSTMAPLLTDLMTSMARITSSTSRLHSLHAAADGPPPQLTLHAAEATNDTACAGPHSEQRSASSGLLVGGARMARVRPTSALAVRRRGGNGATRPSSAHASSPAFRRGLARAASGARAPYTPFGGAVRAPHIFSSHAQLLMHDGSSADAIEDPLHAPASERLVSSPLRQRQLAASASAASLKAVGPTTAAASASRTMHRPASASLNIRQFDGVVVSGGRARGVQLSASASATALPRVGSAPPARARAPPRVGLATTFVGVPPPPHHQLRPSWYSGPFC